MWKKLLVGALAVVVALAVVKGTWLGSHLRLWAKNLGAQAREQVPPEREIERLRMELTGLKGLDERFIDKVARQALDVEKLEAQVGELKKELTHREKELKAMHAALASKDEQVSYNGEKYPREQVAQQLKLDFVSFESDEEVLKSRQAHLSELKRSLTINRKKLSELKVVRERMATELQRVETALSEERRVQAQQDATLDDASYRKLTTEINSVREQIELLKKKRELRGVVTDGPIRAAEQQREQDAKLKARIERRLGDVN